MLGFWNDVFGECAARSEPFFVLAPMAEVTDPPFREIIASCGRPDVFYNEFVSAHGLCSPGRERLLKDLVVRDSDHPIVAQFFGTEPDHFRECGKIAVEMGFDGVDINMGCPDRKVVKQGAGIALAKNSERAKELIAALRQGTIDAGTELPVAVKTRLGYSKTDEMEPWISSLLEAKPDVLIVHGRTMKEMSKVPAHWDLIAKAARMARDANVLFAGNGDVWSREDGVRLSREWDVPGIMVGRGIFQNPWFFEKEPQEHSSQERIDLLLRHAKLWNAHWGELKSFDLMRKFAKAYISGWPGAAELRSRIMQVKSFSQLKDVLESKKAPV